MNAILSHQHTGRSTSQRWIVLGLLLPSVTYGALAAVAIRKGVPLSGRTDFLWAVYFALLVALWTRNDARARAEQKPFEYSLFVFLLWPVVLPYHLVKNRGIDGFLMFLGFLALYALPMVVALITWAYLPR